MATNYGQFVQRLRSERATLQRHVDKLTQAIDALDEASGSTRRRRRMSAASRRAVSLRMKKYWAARRKAAEGK